MAGITPANSSAGPGHRERVDRPLRPNPVGRDDGVDIDVAPGVDLVEVFGQRIPGIEQGRLPDDRAVPDVLWRFGGSVRASPGDGEGVDGPFRSAPGRGDHRVDIEVAGGIDLVDQVGEGAPGIGQRRLPDGGVVPDRAVLGTGRDHPSQPDRKQQDDQGNETRVTHGDHLPCEQGECVVQVPVRRW